MALGWRTVQAKFAKVKNMLAARDVMADAGTDSCTGQKRQNRDGLTGVRNTPARQMAEAQKAFDAFFATLHNAEV